MAVGNPISLTDNVASRIVSQTATASQTDFTISGGYRLNAISVYRNGVRLVSGRDYSAADGSTVVLLSPATVSDSLEFHIFDDFRVADAIVSNASQQNIEGNITITGNIDATNAQLQSLTVTNDVSIGGTLTYEDVKNIDSVGVITARTDVHVGAGLSVVGISTLGSLQVIGTCTFNGNIDLGNASSDTITATGRFDSDLIPSADDEKDLGSSALEWRNLYLDGTANIDTLSISGISTFTGDVFIADKIVHTGDTNTAIRFPAADTITAETGGTERLRITSAGNTGIGTANPVGNLEVRDSKANLIVAKDGLTVKSNSDLHTTYDMLQIGAGGALASYSTATATADTQLVHNAYRHSGGTFKYRYADTAMRLRMNSPGGTFIFESAASGSANADITFSEKLRITSAGLVGIGTNNPEEILHILGPTETISSRDGVTLQHSTATADADNGLPLVWSGYVGSGSGLQNYGLASICGRKENSNADDGAAYLQFGIGRASGAIIERLRINSGGKVGIGTTNPAVSLDLASNTDALSLPTGTTAQRPSGTDAYIRKNSTNNALEFYNGTEWVEIITDYFPTGSTTLG